LNQWAFSIGCVKVLTAKTIASPTDANVLVIESIPTETVVHCFVSACAVAASASTQVIVSLTGHF